MKAIPTVHILPRSTSLLKSAVRQNLIFLTCTTLFACTSCLNWQTFAIQPTSPIPLTGPQPRKVTILMGLVPFFDEKCNPIVGASPSFLSTKQLAEALTQRGFATQVVGIPINFTAQDAEQGIPTRVRRTVYVYRNQVVDAGCSGDFITAAELEKRHGLISDGVWQGRLMLSGVSKTENEQYQVKWEKRASALGDAPIPISFDTAALRDPGIVLRMTSETQLDPMNSFLRVASVTLHVLSLGLIPGYNTYALTKISLDRTAPPAKAQAEITSRIIIWSPLLVTLPFGGLDDREENQGPGRTGSEFDASFVSTRETVIEKLLDEMNLK